MPLDHDERPVHEPPLPPPPKTPPPGKGGNGDLQRQTPSPDVRKEYIRKVEEVIKKKKGEA